MVVWVPRTTAALLGAVCRCRCFVLACLCLLARVGVLGHRRGMALGHACGMPPTGANIAVLLFKTWLAAGSTYTLQPFVVGLGVGMMAVRTALCCAAAAVRVACVCFHRGHQKR